MVVVRGEKILGNLGLPIAGLMSEERAEVVVERLRGVSRSVQALGCKLKDAFMMLSFLGLPVIPRLRITDRGLVSVGERKFVSLTV